MSFGIEFLKDDPKFPSTLKSDNIVVVVSEKIFRAAGQKGVLAVCRSALFLQIQCRKTDKYFKV